MKEIEIIMVISLILVIVIVIEIEIDFRMMFVKIVFYMLVLGLLGGNVLVSGIGWSVGKGRGKGRKMLRGSFWSISDMLLRVIILLYTRMINREYLNNYSANNTGCLTNSKKPCSTLYNILRYLNNCNKK